MIVSFERSPVDAVPVDLVKRLAPARLKALGRLSTKSSRAPVSYAPMLVDLEALFQRAVPTHIIGQRTGLSIKQIEAFAEGMRL